MVHNFINFKTANFSNDYAEFNLLKNFKSVDEFLHLIILFVISNSTSLIMESNFYFMQILKHYSIFDDRNS